MVYANALEHYKKSNVDDVQDAALAPAIAAVNAARNKLPDDEELDEIADILAALSEL